MATRRHFAQEYQDEAVNVVLHSGWTIRDVGRSIGVHEITLGTWVTKAEEGDTGQDKDLSETERAEFGRLRKENTVLRMEPDFEKSGLVRETTAVKYAAIAGWAPERE